MSSPSPSSMHAPSHAAGFDRAAGRYTAAAGLQQSIARALDQLLPGLAFAPRRIWEIGCGTGALTRHLAARFPNAVILAEDRSPAMLMEAARRVRAPRLTWHCGDSAQVAPAEAVDLIASASALHWLGDPERVVHHLAGALRPQGWLAASFMVAGTLREPRLAARRAGLLAPFPDLPDAGAWSAPLARLLQIRSIEVREWCCPAPSAAQALRVIRDQGVNTAPFRPEAPLPPSALRRLCAAWTRELTRPEGGVALTYRVLTVLARKD